MIDVGLSLALGFIAAFVESVDHLFLHLIIRIIFLIHIVLKVIDGILVNKVNLVQMSGDKLVSVSVALGKAEAVVLHVARGGRGSIITQ